MTEQKTLAGILKDMQGSAVDNNRLYPLHTKGWRDLMKKDRIKALSEIKELFVKIVDELKEKNYCNNCGIKNMRNCGSGIDDMGKSKTVCVARGYQEGEEKAIEKAQQKIRRMK